MDPIRHIRQPFTSATEQLVEAAQAMQLEERDEDVLQDWVDRLKEPVRRMASVVSKDQMKTKLVQLSMVNMDLQGQLNKQKELTIRIRSLEFTAAAMLADIVKANPQQYAQQMQYLILHYPELVGVEES